MFKRLLIKLPSRYFDLIVFLLAFLVRINFIMLNCTIALDSSN